MKTTRLFGVLLALCAARSLSPANFSSSSGIAWSHNAGYTAGTFAFGMESTPTGPDSGQGATALHIENIPFGITSLELINGTLTMQGNQKGAVLVRIGVIGDPSGGDGAGLGIPGSALLFNDVLNVANGEPCTIPIPPFRFDNIQQYIQVPSSGGPYQFFVYFGFAGAQWPMDAEIELNGRWTAQ